jgi:Domain of unknown function (DUF4384)
MRLLLIGFSVATALLAQEGQRIKVSVERQDTGGWRAVNPATVFAAGDRLRFRVSTSFPGYLYVTDRGTSGSYDLLFPTSDTGSDNRIAASKDYTVPARQGWFRVAGPQGHDIVYWVLSPTELGRQYRPLPPPPAPGTVPPSIQPRCDDAIFKARGECIDASAGVKPVQPGEKLPDNLNGVAGANSRDLVFAEEKGQTVVSSPNPLSGPIIYELRLAHR